MNYGVHGIQVTLYDADNGEITGTTTTDSTGKYSFCGLINQEVPLINPLKKYKVRYTYNGQLYQPTYFKNDISGYYSNGKEDSNVRKQYNEIFKDIYHEYSGYEVNGKWHKSYALSEEIKKDDDSFVTINSSGEPLKYMTVLSKFLSLAEQSKFDLPQETDGAKIWDKEKNYEWVLDNPQNTNSLSNWLYGLGANSEVKPVIQFIKDTFISADTQQSYPVKNQFAINKVGQGIDTYQYNDPYSIKIDKNFTYLYTKSSDQSRFVNFGLTYRSASNMVIQNDVYKVTTVANGKKQDYFYNKKDSNNWRIGIKATDNIYNEKSQYIRKIRKSDYLYNTEYDERKNLDVYVTYRITATNHGKTNIKVDEIVDYYDTDVFEFDGKLNSDNTYEKNLWYKYDADGNIIGEYYNTYNGKDENGEKLNDDVVVKNKGIRGEDKQLSGSNYNYGTIYLTGISSENGTILRPKEKANVFVTFKVKKENNKIRMDNENSIGKKNIAELNAYTSYYADGTKIPQYLDNEDNPVYEKIEGNNTVAGIVDGVSTPGSLSTADLDENGNIITGDIGVEEKRFNLFTYRLENDIDQAPRLKLIFDDENDRSIKGYTFEDSRNYSENTGKAVIGNGTYEDGEAKINGVTVELVELLPNVDENGIFRGTYSGERVWDSYTYNDLSNGANPNVDNQRYASGRYKSRIIINGPENSPLRVSEDTLGEGEYEFKSLPPGDFYVRFKYGDTAETTMISSEKIEARRQVLQNKVDMQDPNMTESEKIELKTINSINEVNKAVPNVEDYQGTQLRGRNTKSYNGQDYKSTIYQKDMTQNLSYNGIDGYLRFDTQNYSSGEDASPNNGTDKSSMYYYNIDEGDKNSQQSDGKDVYYYRQRANTYSKGGQGEKGESLLNNRAEILSSFEKMSTFKSYEYDENGNVKHQNRVPVENEEEKNKNQKQMINELMNNTQMVAQTGIIDTEVEYNRKQTIYQGENLNYKLDNLNLGLTERPVAELSLNNEVDNVEVTLSNGKTLFNTSQSVANLYYSKHQEHNTMYRPLLKDRNQPALLKDTLVNKRIEYKNNKEVAVSEAELIQAYVDDELRAGANMKIRYKMNVKNTGEVDYVDKKFYYTGIEENPEDLSRISKTNAKKIVDYVGNSIIYDTNMENANNKTKQIETWDITKLNELIPSTVVEKNKAPVSNNEIINNDYINRQYAFETNTYNTILTTSKLSKDLVPMYNENGDSSIGDIYLTVSTEIGMSSDQNKLVYNNMSEIIEIANTLGRRCRYSIVGNEEMADQTLGDNAAETARSSMDRIKPFEIDTDSAQKVLIMPPTGKR